MKNSSPQPIAYLTAVLSVVAFTLTVTDAPLWVLILAWISTYGLVTGLRGEAQRRHFALVATMLLVLGISPLGTSTDVNPGAIMTLGMLVAASLPFLVQKFSKADADLLHLRFKWARPTRIEWGYIAFAATLTSLVIASYFFTSGAGHSWHMETLGATLISFAAIMIIGAWEEVFFIAGIFGILRRYLPYRTANILQAIAFTTFLYAFGFHGWVLIFVLWYTYYQGFVYRKTGNLLITLIIHAIVDLIVFLAILFSIQPAWLFG